MEIINIKFPDDLLQFFEDYLIRIISVNGKEVLYLRYSFYTDGHIILYYSKT